LAFVEVPQSSSDIASAAVERAKAVSTQLRVEALSLGELDDQLASKAATELADSMERLGQLLKSKLSPNPSAGNERHE
jgi:uncharacterized membrane protein